MKNKMKTIKVITVSAVIFIILLLGAMIINLIKVASVTSKEKNLIEQIETLSYSIEECNSELEYLQSREYIERYARELLNMKRKNEKIFKGSE